MCAASSRTCGRRGPRRARCWSGGTCARARPGSRRPAGGRSRAEGMTAVGCGVVPTPALALEAARRGAAAVMVTGSHIPFDRNGLKFYRPGGEEIGKGDEAGILAALAAPGPARAGADPGRFGRGRALRGAVGGVLRRRVSRAGFASGSTSTAPPGASRCAGRSPRSGRRWSRSGGATSFVPIDTEAIDARAGGAHPGVGGGAPAGGAGVDGRGRRPAARRRRDRAGAARGRARGAGGAAPRGGRGGGAAERQHGAGGLGLVRAGRCARGSARRTSSRGWRG